MTFGIYNFTIYYLFVNFSILLFSQLLLFSLQNYDVSSNPPIIWDILRLFVINGHKCGTI